jgi:hypothetical protein
MFLLFSACSMDPNPDVDKKYDDTALEVTAAPVVHIPPCGLWIAASDAAAIARHDAAPTNADMVQLALPGGLACTALIAAVDAVNASWGGGHSVVYPILAPGKMKTAMSFQQLLDAGPDAVYATIDDSQDQDPSLKIVCTRWETLPCGYVLGRTLYCRMCVCEEIQGCHGDPMCAGCAPGF